MPSRRPILVLVMLGVLLAAVVLLRLLAGKVEGRPVLALEFTEFRWLRVGAGAAVGVALAVAGVMLQSLLRNPLASPDILGLASGSGLGIMAASYVAYRAGQGLAAHETLSLGTGGAALAGSLGSLGLVWVLSRRRGLLDPVTIILVGVAVSIMSSAGTMLVRHLLPDQGMSAGRLLLGWVRDPSGWELGVVGAVTLAGTAVAFACGRAMDAAALGEEEARSVGVRIGRLRTVLFISSGVLTAASVVLAGPVGFVGLICPHAVRLMTGPSHRVLVAGSALSGAAMVVLCDALVRLVDLGSGQMPIGVVTSLVGGPVLIALLRREHARV